jgi:SAM-dependent methyltransferase
MAAMSTEATAGTAAVGERAVVPAMPRQAFKAVLGEAEMRAGMERLSPDTPWAHYFDLGPVGQTVGPSQAVYYEKAKTLKLIGTQVVEAVPFITRRGAVAGLSVLDLACAEGQHAIELAMAGADRVVGVDGRQLYVDRSSFIARCFGARAAQFLNGDVRSVDPARVGRFELILFFGILHHLAPDDFFPMLQRLHRLSSDTVLIYTHTVDDRANKRFGQSLGAPIRNAHGYAGRPFREHADDTTPEERASRLRSSLDNTFSFWAEEPELLRALKDAGFRYVSRQLAPNPFPDPVNEFRVLYVARV